ncbi:periodic tryptophan protein 2 homolog [Sphaerodactylus townsendi]|uniref:periodic tryptophan protein 2 homolog n=1 Tax=Sphaerodactylus townsendi TaxID=933632 RepID=UPI002026A21F|nr:periodic tryptophan protein 2 homolog [Sphaerodactylus townsendi]
MKFAYKFSNLLGTVYRCGNLNFTPDGNSLISPVGNRITVFDLKNNKSETLPLAARYNITCVGLSPDGNLAILVDEEGAALLVSLISKSVIHQFNFQKPVRSVCFSPNGKKFVVTKDKVALMYHAPGKKREFNAFVLDTTYYGAYDETTCIDWTDDSKCFAVGSKDMSTWVFGAERWANLIYYALGGHKDSIVSCFFEENSLDLYTISRDGALCVWQCDTELNGLKPRMPKQQSEDKEELTNDQEEEFTEEPWGKEIHGKVNENEQESRKKVKYSCAAKYFFNKEGDFNNLTSAAYHKKTHLLVTGFASGIFHLHELPYFNLIHSLSISDQKIAAISINSTGDWIAFGCAGLGQLLVWEWQSESYVLKQQGHFSNLVSLAYSPDGQYLATGGDDGKVKVWNTTSGFCFVTFTEHTSSISAVTFTSSGYVILSASLDGTVRAFDLHRYRNFRTFTSPRPTQFSSLAVDSSGEIISAGSQDSFEVFLWSMQSGRLLDVLAGHEGPISSLCFNPMKCVLASASWDKTVRLWDMLDSWKTKETLALNSDVLAVAFSPDGNELAVASLDGQITFWDHDNAVQTGSIEGRHDLQMGRKELDKITAKQAAKGKSFTTLCYSADGQSILAGGMSKFVCIYHIKEQIIIKKFEISCNLSLDAMEEFLDRRKMTEFGSMALIDEGTGDDDGVAIPLPGVKRGDLSSRHFKPEIRVTCLRFSPTGRSWAATTTEGLLIYSLDSGLIFDPFDLEIDITPSNVHTVLHQKEYAKAIVMAFRLNEKRLIQEVLENVPYNDIEVICSSLPELYVEKMLEFLASSFETSRHLEFYLLWTQRLLMLHGCKLKTRSGKLLPTIQFLQKNIQCHFEEVSKLCDWNCYNMKYILAISQQRGMKRTAEESENDEDLQDLEESRNDSPMEESVVLS